MYYYFKQTLQSEEQVHVDCRVTAVVSVLLLIASNGVDLLSHSMF